MQTRREMIAAFAGTITLAGCTGAGDNPTEGPDRTSTDENDEPTTDDAGNNETGQESVADEGTEDDSSESDSPDCAATVRIESGGMEPNLPRGSEVCVVQYNSYQPVNDPEETGIIPVETGEQIGYEKLGGNGDIIRYYPDGNKDSTPVIARALRWEDGFYVTKGDKNSEPYPWDAPIESIIGVVRTTIE